MKLRALEFLVCPKCHGDLELQAIVADGSEVWEGTLRCGPCGSSHPILRGVPRFTGAADYASSFGFQWNWFRAVQIDSLNGTLESERALEAATGWTDGDYRGRLVLDAGAGAGRFAEVVAGKGGEVVGVDLSCAVDAAFSTMGRLAGVHLVQADLFALPFRRNTFDLAYSIGVLHHTPDPRAAFESVASTVKPGGGLAIYVYGGYGPGHRGSDLIRRLTTRLPWKVMLALSALSIPLYPFYRIPVLGRLLQLLVPISGRRNWRWRWLDTFDWYTPRYQWKLLYPEVIGWFRACGFPDIMAFDGPIRIRGVKREGWGADAAATPEERATPPVSGAHGSMAQAARGR